MNQDVNPNAMLLTTVFLCLLPHLSTPHTPRQEAYTRREIEAQRLVLELMGMTAWVLSKPRRGLWGPSGHPYPLPFSLPHSLLGQMGARRRGYRNGGWGGSRRPQGKGVQSCTKPGTEGGWESDSLPLLDYLLSTVLL